MKSIFTFLLASIAFSNVLSQKYYTTSGGEFIFSRTVSNEPVQNSNSRTRFSAFFHFNQFYHYNLTESFGGFGGFSISNIGFIYEEKDTIFKKRVYTFGIPFGLKIGNLENERYLFGGGEIEFPFHYKQKRIYDGQKDKYAAFFDKRSNTMLPSLFAGVQFPSGLCLKFRYYLSDFLNKNFEGVDFGRKMDYSTIDSRIFILSISFNLKETKLKDIIKNENNRYANLNI